MKVQNVTIKCTVLITGIFSIFPQKSIDGAKIPKLRPDAEICEATYGDKLHSNREIEEERFYKKINLLL